MHNAHLRPFVQSLRHSHALVVITVFLVGLGIYRYYRLQLAAIDEEIKEAAINIRTAYGVDVHYHFDRKAFLPPENFGPALKADWLSLSRTKVRRNLSLVLDDFLSKYPKHVVRSNLTDLYLLGKLEFGGKRYGGTYFGPNIYINGSGPPDDLLRILHAEFSSILFHKYDFPKQEWAAISGSLYLNSDGGAGYWMVDDPSRLVQTEDLLSNGFLTKYSTTDLENDFNMFVGWAFTRPQELGKLASRHEKIRKKMELVVRFYKSIDTTIEIPARAASTGREEKGSMLSIFDLIAAFIGYPLLAIAGIILHLRFRRTSTLIFAVGSSVSLLAFALSIFGGMPGSVLTPLSFLIRSVGLLWLAIDLKRIQKAQ